MCNPFSYVLGIDDRAVELRRKIAPLVHIDKRQFRKRVGKTKLFRFPFYPNAPRSKQTDNFLEAFHAAMVANRIANERHRAIARTKNFLFGSHLKIREERVKLRQGRQRAGGGLEKNTDL